MMAKEKFNKLYSEVADGLSNTLQQLQGLRVEHEDSKEHVIGMMAKLEEIQKRFSDEITLLEDNAEWDKFTIAFFGETNAGKSTIIESLRIMFNEEARQNAIVQNRNQLSQFEMAVAEQSEQLKRAFSEAYGALAQDLLALQQDVVLFKRFMDAEKSKREALEVENQSLRKDSISYRQSMETEKSKREALEVENQSLRKDCISYKQSMEAEKSKREGVEFDNLALRKQSKNLKVACITTSCLTVIALGVVVWLVGGI